MRWQDQIKNADAWLVPFHWTHPLAMNLRPFDREFMQLFPDAHDRLRAFQTEGESATIMIRGRMAGSFGIFKYWNGMAEAWLLTDYLFESLPVSAVKSARRILYRYAAEEKLNRMQMTINNRNEVALKWARVLGFTPEGILRKYGPDGSDYTMFARVT